MAKRSATPVLENNPYEPSRNFKWNCIIECEDCPVKDHCPIADDEEDGYCGWEKEDFSRLMKSLDKEYLLNESSKLIAENLIANLLVAKRGLRELKLSGVLIKEEDEDGILRTIENPIKRGLHLEHNRIIRLLKEMKLTPKEAGPRVKKVDVKDMLDEVVERLAVKNELREDQRSL